ncbi:MAG: calcineurin-like phosphoesterase C-terminal domain-containing protein [Bacteroides sp.]|nr:calcineurin-like phosphoesterase C-terminal domain-containing protein [Bacteroides sp.]
MRNKYIVFLLLTGCWLCGPLSVLRGGNGISGRVTCEQQGMAQVVVTNGIHCTQTDENGYYTLPATEQATFVYLSTPAGYLPEREKSLPRYYQRLEPGKEEGYDFTLLPNPYDDTRHVCVVHADPQVYKEENFIPYRRILADCKETIEGFSGMDVFGIDCGDLVSDKPELYPAYIEAVDQLDTPFYRVIGNHDLTLYERSHDTSYQTFEAFFGPTYYSFNQGKAHYVVLNDVFYLGRDYFYMGYIGERLLAWLEKDLSYVEEGSLVFVALHIPTRLEEQKIPFEYSNGNIAGRVSNAAFLYEILKPYQTHIFAGHTHYNRNLVHAENLYEHITAAVCGTWWQGDVCLDGTPQGYGVYLIEGDEVTWYYKSAGYPRDYQLRAYAPGSSASYPGDLLANVWNWDKDWTVEWTENGKVMGAMERISACDPKAEALCADKEKLEFPWISAMPNEHMFRATPHDPSAVLSVRATDRFGHIYESHPEQPDSLK